MCAMRVSCWGSNRGLLFVLFRILLLLYSVTDKDFSHIYSVSHIGTRRVLFLDLCTIQTAAIEGVERVSRLTSFIHTNRKCDAHDTENMFSGFPHLILVTEHELSTSAPIIDHKPEDNCKVDLTSSPSSSPLTSPRLPPISRDLQEAVPVLTPTVSSLELHAQTSSSGSLDSITS
ncbi:hypothetical protein C8Q75DRAFT_456006 [Abortiporus biennis]|nr:hypothetical protein C8Q75DRAFT_456006 [Abortiporus biennis]